MLCRNVGTESHVGEHADAFNVTCGVSTWARHDHPTRPEACKAICLRQTIKGDGEYIGSNDSKSGVHSVVVQNLVVNFIGHHNETVLHCEVGNFPQHFRAIHSTRWVVGIDDDNCFGALCNFRAHIFNVRHPTARLIAQIMHGLATRQTGCSGPQRVVGSWDEHFVAFVEQRIESNLNELAHAIS